MYVWRTAWYMTRGHVTGGVWCHVREMFGGCAGECRAIHRAAGQTRVMLGGAGCVSLVGVVYGFTCVWGTQHDM